MFELNGVQYSLEDLQAAAQKYNMDFEEYIEKMRAKGLVEVDQAPIVEEKPQQKLLKNKKRLRIHSFVAQKRYTAL
jgi:hypothetical protein